MITMRITNESCAWMVAIGLRKTDRTCDDFYNTITLPDLETYRAQVYSVNTEGESVMPPQISLLQVKKN